MFTISSLDRALDKTLQSVAQEEQVGLTYYDSDKLNLLDLVKTWTQKENQNGPAMYDNRGQGGKITNVIKVFKKMYTMEDSGLPIEISSHSLTEKQTDTVLFTHFFERRRKFANRSRHNVNEVFKRAKHRSLMNRNMDGPVTRQDHDRVVKGVAGRTCSLRQGFKTLHVKSRNFRVHQHRCTSSLGGRSITHFQSARQEGHFP